jgi:DNA-binding transcriptional MerR regulator
MYFDEIKIGQSDLEKLVAENATGAESYVSLYSTRRFYIGNTGINRKTLNDWENAELLPFAYNDTGWRKFSFLEWVWLESINEFRQLGVSIDKIKNVKELLFTIDADHLIQLFKDNIETIRGKTSLNDEDIEAINHPEFAMIMKTQFQEMQFCVFLLLVLRVVTTGENYCLVYTNNDFCSLFVMGTAEKEIKEASQLTISNLISESFVVVNLKKVVNKLLLKPGLRTNDNFILDFLSPKEKTIIDHIRDSNAKEIIISFDNDSNPVQIKVNRNRISSETINKVARYLKKGNFQNISFKTRNGQLISYDETDIIKI